MSIQKIEIIVQHADENGEWFGVRLTRILNEISEKNKEQLTLPRIIFMTSAADGRQTATICYFLKTKDDGKR